MEANLFLLIGSGVLVATGVYLMLDRALTRMIMGVLLLGNGANLLLLQSGGQAGSPPIIGRMSTLFGERTADPLAQAMILTAIVISMAMVAFMLALAYRQYRYRTDDIIERDEEDRAIAARPKTPAAAPDHDASDDPETGRMSSEGDAFGPRSFEDPVKEADDDE
ncbi:Na(+)/H(+) antiporter subunit C [Corynebacterium sp. NML98-0116]|uniref:Na(+)/H(+) antiporter subunit C n=1 Tax=Corynebacterium lipophilum TaxID=2804918 RepID=A0AAW5I071_9CORY|nr:MULTISPECIES: Na(+)/H(+) antiporter subunit C [Corynebacterium]AOX04990.1 Na(+)/H(+) antiporter subunit C [Corynebacterium sp. NML98-0116]MCO6395476.1 Na(+)/H(+) antiporter subunit C [Corynebacterium lipophilum]MCQ4610415.1 Na(+)/H(+) antiporter subunit C [Corynebacterium sp. CCUG 61414]MCQ4616683.1 Na(+)/H(+) antiporter subunit C [Corynebacterium pseudogenitalium]MCZ2118195.1 Na(+)/H(+) antiporter subunit C [Corynebacterium lipophilum]